MRGFARMGRVVRALVLCPWLAGCSAGSSSDLEGLKKGAPGEPGGGPSDPAGIDDDCLDGSCDDDTIHTCLDAKEKPSNVGCEFYAVDLDLSDAIVDPANAPWGVVIANAGPETTSVVVEQNDAAVGAPPSASIVVELSVAPDDLAEVALPTREIDCAQKPGDWGSPGTCLSSRAYRISSTGPIVVYQFNNLVHGYATDASLLLPTTAVGTKYRVTGWPAAHSFPSPGAFVQRSYVTVVGTEPGTLVEVRPGWRVRGNAPIAATPAGATLTATLGPFDVLNLESDDATLSECVQMQTPPYCADMTGTFVDASAPVVVFTGTEQSGVGLPYDAPKPPAWDDTKGCCNQHLEEQLFPAESFGRKFLVTRSPVRSNPEFTSWEEPDVIRFVGAAAVSVVSTNLPAPYDTFTLQPGEVKDAWAQQDFVVSATEPIVVAQLLVAQDYVEPQPKGDPSLTLFPPIEQARRAYVFLSPAGWSENWVVIGTEPSTTITLDGAPADCPAFDAGELDGVGYHARRCAIAAGVHRLAGDGPFQIMAYGYADADTYSFAGGANIEKIYEVPQIY